MISIPSRVLAAIMREGERAYPDECCGAIIGTDDGEHGRAAEDIFPVHNGRESEERYHRFAISPEDYMSSEKAAEGRGLDVIGFYHSHPDHAAIPSEYDREHAMPWYSYVITAVGGGCAENVTSWTLAADRSRFEAERIAVPEDTSTDKEGDAK